MAIRQIRKEGDPVLYKKTRPVEDFGDKTNMIIDDMIETMYEADGVGLAAPQVGVLRKIVVIDVGQGVIVMCNPKIVEQSGRIVSNESCLSVPGKYGSVARPTRVKAVAQDREGNTFEIEGEGLLAKAICHELDHLDGLLYTSKVIGEIKTAEE